MSFKFGKIKFELSFPLVCLMTAVIIFDTSMSVILCFLSALLHETGHILALKYYKSYPEKIKLTLFDVAIIDRKKYSRTDKSELIITLSGVAVNFFLSAVSFILFRIFNHHLLSDFSYANLTLALFNSLPVDSLDGGQALFIILSKYLSPVSAVRTLNIISFIVLIPTAVVGFLILLQSKYNFTLLLTALYLIALILLKK